MFSLEDISLPEYCALAKRPSDVIIHCWFGPGGTVSPAHTDPYHNLFAQVVGEKYIRLYSPDYSDCMYPHPGKISHNSFRHRESAPQHIPSGHCCTGSCSVSQISGRTILGGGCSPWRSSVYSPKGFKLLVDSLAVVALRAIVEC